MKDDLMWWIKKQRYKKQKENEKFYLNRARNQKFYTSKRWIDLRNYHLSLHPWCITCALSGLTNVYDLEVHHKININTADGWANRYNVDDLQTLCRSCHQKETVKEQTERRQKEHQDRIDCNMDDLNNYD